MDKCRICLLNKSYVRPINELREGISYASMLSSVANIKVAEENNEVLCHLCSQKLRDCYNFKLLIIRSNQEVNVNSKVFKFDCIKDIKDQIFKQNSPTSNNKERIKKTSLYKSQNDTYYNNTLTPRLEISKEKLTAIYNLEIESDEDTYGKTLNDIENCNEKNKEKVKVIEKDINKKSDKNCKKPQIFKKVLIKPKYLEDYRLVPTEVIKRQNIIPNEIGKREDICPYCGKATRYLKAHLQLHTASQKYECNDCARKFSTKPNLKRHIKTHYNERNYKCDICVAAFNNKGTLSRHLYTHTDLKNHKCHICNKAFKWKTSLHRHILIHNINAKSFICEFCNRSFLNKDRLNVHTRIHTGERPYSCEICSKPYSDKRYFNKHCLKKHGVFLDGRPVYVMDAETLKNERVLMKDLMLRVNGIPTDREPLDSFKGRQKAQAFAKAVKAMQERKIPVDI